MLRSASPLAAGARPAAAAGVRRAVAVARPGRSVAASAAPRRAAAGGAAPAPALSFAALAASIGLAGTPPAGADEAAASAPAAAADAAAAAGDAAAEASQRLPPIFLIIPLALYGAFYVYREQVNPRAKLSDALFITAALAIFANIASILAFKTRFF